MNVLVVHNRYREAGGEDRVVELETGLLERHGHRVTMYTPDNASLAGMNTLRMAGRTLWNRTSYGDVRQLIARAAIDIVHVHNTLPIASPSVYYAAAAEGVPVVQTLHNYRLLCANAVFVRDGRPCVSCVGTAGSIPAVVHGCYRGSRAASGAIAAMLLVHGAAGTWRDRIDTYIAPTTFARGVFVAGGLPAARIVVKPHFVDPDPGPGPGRGGYALYAGRLSTEKGIDTLLTAWSRLTTPVPLILAGDGPLAGRVARAAAEIAGVTWLGRQDRAQVQRLMGDAAALIFPSIAFETFGQVIPEAFAAGTPVVASSGGAAAELIDAGRTGALVRPGDATELAARIDALFSTAGALISMRPAARAAYTARFTAAANYPPLIAIYRAAMARAAQLRARAGTPARSGRAAA